MKLDRNENDDGKGKYALIRLRGIKSGTEAHGLLQRLYDLGHLDWGCVGDPDEFFVIKLRDQYAYDAIHAYSDAVLKDAQREQDEEKSKAKFKWSVQVLGLCNRAGDLSPFKKEPD